MATKFKRGSTWYIKTKDETGTWVPICCGKNATATDAETLRKIYDSKELNQRHQTNIRKIDRSMTECLDEFKDKILPRSEIGRDKAFNTIRREKVVIKNFREWLELNNIPEEFNIISEEIIQRYFDHLSQENKAAKTRREERRILSKFFSWSKDSHYTTKNPVDKIINPRKTKKRPRFFSEDELKIIFTNSRPPYRNIFKFLFLTGLRVGELCHLEWTDYIESKQLILIRVMDGNKTKREETVPLNKDAIAIIKEQRDYLKKFDTPESKRLIFVNMIGLELDNKNVYDALKRILIDKNIPNASTHTLRHTCASHLVIKGVSLYVVKEILRHASIKETEVYAHLSKEAVTDAIRKLHL